MRALLEKWFNKIWHKNGFMAVALSPLSWLFGALVKLRRSWYRNGKLKSRRLSCPVIIVGNITVGGTGKTPFIIWLIKQLSRQDITAGVISRGHGRLGKELAEVTMDSHVNEVGDEPLLIHKKTGSPVFVAQDRASAGGALLEKHDVDVIISDDGLQHYKLQRDMEIVLIDSERGFGNGRLLPAGPLREPESRLSEADTVIANIGSGERRLDISNISMRMDHSYVVALATGEKREITSFEGSIVHAVAGIGHPERFFGQLRSAGLKIIPHIFPDHAVYKEADLSFNDGASVLMTEKDAIKCESFAQRNWWYVPVTVRLSQPGEGELLDKISLLVN
ncbi:MAG: tetraacyldisaccharide 4'-kinase [Gammaproteobacteria bacterium]|nr:tetraacyldisaccharide 4'-kinase [Gammaproteobacteria bacterium]